MEINGNEINFGKYKISVADNGIYIDGVFKYDVAIAKTQAQGSTTGYASGGYNTPLTTTYTTIDSFPFSADTNATDVGDLSQAEYYSAGQSSRESGYSSGGANAVPATVVYNGIDKFPFASVGTATSVNTLSQARWRSAGQSSTISGYSSGGGAPTLLNIIDKFPFSADTPTTDVGDLTQARSGVASQSSTESGYTSGGEIPAIVDTIDRFPFASDVNAVDVGNLSQLRFILSGQSSSVSGYSSGGQDPALTPTVVSIIDRFPFASDANATNIGDLTGQWSGTSGQSSTENGYASGGALSSNIIHKFPFANDSGAQDVGDLSVGRFGTAGQQV